MNYLMASLQSIASHSTIGGEAVPRGMKRRENIKTIGGLNRPWSVTVNQRREIIVVEYGGHCISIFSPSGEKIRTFGRGGSAQGQLGYPRGVAVYGDGNILVVDRDNHRIQKFTADGKFLTAVGQRSRK